jgi:hypothetical protein
MRKKIHLQQAVKSTETAPESDNTAPAHTLEMPQIQMM